MHRNRYVRKMGMNLLSAVCRTTGHKNYFVAGLTRLAQQKSCLTSCASAALVEVNRNRCTQACTLAPQSNCLAACSLVTESNKEDGLLCNAACKSICPGGWLSFHLFKILSSQKRGGQEGYQSIRPAFVHNLRYYFWTHEWILSCFIFEKPGFSVWGQKKCGVFFDVESATKNSRGALRCCAAAMWRYSQCRHHRCNVECCY